MPRAAVWRAWTEPELLEEWWCPRPWHAVVCDFELEPGGAFETLLRGPDGESHLHTGVFLEIMPEARIVWTTALTEGWRPAQDDLPMTVIVTLADDGEGTRYHARVLHRSPEDALRHRELGFDEGWSAATATFERCPGSRARA